MGWTVSDNSGFSIDIPINKNYVNRDACGNDGWLVDDVNLFDPSDAYISHPLVRLEPYTQYAYYVKAYTLATERCFYFRFVSRFRLNKIICFLSEPERNPKFSIFVR